MEEAQNQSGQRNVLAVTNPLYDHLYTPMPAAPHTEYDHLTSREESAAVECPADDISEELVCRFARQISDGMEHLEKEGVRIFLHAGRSAIQWNLSNPDMVTSASAIVLITEVSSVWRFMNTWENQTVPRRLPVIIERGPLDRECAKRGSTVLLRQIPISFSLHKS